jgi:apolipoprotein N-acyltransferase
MIVQRVILQQKKRHKKAVVIFIAFTCLSRASRDVPSTAAVLFFCYLKLIFEAPAKLSHFQASQTVWL